MRSGAAFVHHGAWGDLYVATAALAEVAAEFSSTGVTVVGSLKWKDILDPKTWPAVRTIVHSDDGKSGDLYRVGALGDWELTERDVALTRVFKGLAASFNIRTESLRFGWAPLLARVPRRHGSAPAPWSWLLYTHRAPWLGKDPLIHERDRMLQVVEAPNRIGELARKWSAGSGLPRLRLADPARVQAQTGVASGKYWLINPTSSRREKAWPSSRFRELFARLKPLLEARGLELRLLGAPPETEWLRECLPEGLDPARFIVQPRRIFDLMDALSGAGLLITNTSSAQFLCPGLATRTLTLMGRADPLIWGPLGSDAIVVRGDAKPLAPGEDLFESERRAYESIPLERVLAECEKVLLR